MKKLKEHMLYIVITIFSLIMAFAIIFTLIFVKKEIQEILFWIYSFLIALFTLSVGSYTTFRQGKQQEQIDENIQGLKEMYLSINKKLEFLDVLQIEKNIIEQEKIIKSYDKWNDKTKKPNIDELAEAIMKIIRKK